MHNLNVFLATNNGARDYLRAHVQNRQTGQQQQQQQQGQQAQQMRPQTNQLMGQSAMIMGNNGGSGNAVPGTGQSGSAGVQSGGGPGMLSPQQQQQPATPNMMGSPDMFFELTTAGENLIDALD